VALSAPRGESVAIEIPYDLAAVRERDPGGLASWREFTRTAFQTCLGAGYSVDDFLVLREAGEGRSFYLLSPDPGPDRSDPRRSE